MASTNTSASCQVRSKVLRMLHKAKASHLGSNMSAVEMQLAMYSSVDLSLLRIRDPNRARIIISKGHCAAVTYAILNHFGILNSEDLDTYHLNGSLLTGHVSHCVRGVEHSTGALGHGINVAVGCALGLYSRNLYSVPVLCLVGDGELQEGSIWEALMLAAHHRLSNLTILVDNNKISSIDDTRKVIDLSPLEDKFLGFGLNVYDVDGHSVCQIQEAIKAGRSSNKPSVVICNTVKGKDVPFAESSPIWHYKSLTDEQLSEALTYLSHH